MKVVRTTEKKFVPISVVMESEQDKEDVIEILEIGINHKLHFDHSTHFYDYINDLREI